MKIHDVDATKEFQEKIRGLRKYPKGKYVPKQYVSCWSEKDVIDNEIVDAFVIILRTRGCSWALKSSGKTEGFSKDARNSCWNSVASGCSMCGYINDAMIENVSDEDLFFQFSEAMKKFNDQKIVKIFTSGSFLDKSEVSEKLQEKICETLGKKTEKVIVESRPEFVNKEKLKKLKKLCALEIAVGLESANDNVLGYSINKGFTLKDYIRAAEIIKDICSLKTYILLKPPFLTEKEGIKDAINTVKIVGEYSSTISLNPVNIQKNTFVEFLWKRNEYRPPWLWSVVEVLKESKKLTDAHLMCSPTGGGTRRGAHNCGRCDQKILGDIQDFSLTQNLSVFDNLYCECKEEWLDMLEVEGFMQ
ncbi:MAG: archaeosine biosynthesis radical SAM protein RaSEA [Candidatus Thermoplasmatota archaeon]|nr:archaeosine biosynthesis radical SAM protein RaSEA [Candidatus Thermoplasmatota archaeon]